MSGTYFFLAFKVASLAISCVTCGILHHAQIGQNAYTEYVHTIYTYKLGECGALWGERERVVWSTCVAQAPFKALPPKVLIIVFT